LQLALSLGQANIRDGGIRWPYILLVLADICLNAIGLLVLYEECVIPLKNLPAAIPLLRELHSHPDEIVARGSTGLLHLLNVDT
jgi:hypothetical protein